MSASKTDHLPSPEQSALTPNRATPPDRRGAVGQVPWTMAQTLLGTSITLVPWLLLQLVTHVSASASTPGRPLARGVDAADAVVAFVTSAVIEAAFLLVPAYYASARRQRSVPGGLPPRTGLRALGVRRADWRRAGGAIAIGIGLIVGVNLLYSALITVFHLGIQINSDQLIGLAHTMPLTLIGYLAAAVLVAPICEEIFFRGFLFGGLLNGMSFWPAAVLSALLFGIAHFDLGSLPVLFVIGMVLAWVRWRFGSLLPGIALHACNNLLAAIFILSAIGH